MQPAARSLRGKRLARQGTGWRVEVNVRLGLGEIAAEKSRDRGAIPADAREDRGAAVLHCRLYARRLAGAAGFRVGVASFGRDAVAQPVEKSDDEFLRFGRAKADRACRAGIDRDTVVRIRRGKVQ